MVDNYLKIPEFINIVDSINKRNFLDANLKLDSLISKDKDSYFLNNIKGVILLNLGDLNNAEIFLKKSINLNINFIEAYSNLGTVFFLKKNFLESIKNFEHCVNAGEKLDYYYLNIANCYRELNNFDDSLKFFGTFCSPIKTFHSFGNAPIKLSLVHLN